MMKFSGVSEHRQNVLYSVFLMPITAMHHPLFSPGSAGSWDQIEWQFRDLDPYEQRLGSSHPKEAGRCISPSVLTCEERNLYAWNFFKVTQIIQVGIKSVWAEMPQRVPATTFLRPERSWEAFHCSLDLNWDPLVHVCLWPSEQKGKEMLW